MCEYVNDTNSYLYSHSVELHFDMIFDFFLLLLTFELVVVRNVLRIVTIFNMRTKQMNKKRSNNNLQSFIWKCNVLGIKSNPPNMFHVFSVSFSKKRQISGAFMHFTFYVYRLHHILKSRQKWNIAHVVCSSRGIQMLLF